MQRAGSDTSCLSAVSGVGKEALLVLRVRTRLECLEVKGANVN